MTNVAVGITVSCIRCGHDLSCEETRAGGVLRCDPCENCLSVERKEAYEEGVNDGQES